MKKVLVSILAIFLTFSLLSTSFGVYAGSALPATSVVKIKSKPAGMVVKWKARDGVEGYEIQYSTSKDFTKKTSGIWKVRNKNTYYTRLYNLEISKKYFVRVRTYKGSLNSKWSAPETVKTGKAKLIALTFDDGPGYNKKASKKILDTLEKYNAKATFFIVGSTMKGNEKNIKKKVKLGMELGNHTINHKHYGKSVTASDIKKCSNKIYKLTGKYPSCFRSPGGSTTAAIRNECKKENMPLYYWSVDTKDWRDRNKNTVYNRVMKNVKDGDIILMHELYTTTAEALEKMVPVLCKKGYKLVTCEELVYAKTGKKPVAGQQYVNAKRIKNNTK